MSSCKPSEVRSIDVKLNVMHHQNVVPNTTIYLKKGVTVFPGFDTNDYEEIIISDDQGIARFKDLQADNYYLLGLGHDGIDSVYGHQPMVLNRTMLDLEIEQIMWVSEVH
jgi:hypothetical protein